MNISNKNWKKAVCAIFKKCEEIHFKFKQCKRFILRRGKDDILVRGEISYKNDLGLLKNITKRGTSVSAIEPDNI